MASRNSVAAALKLRVAIRKNASYTYTLLPRCDPPPFLGSNHLLELLAASWLLEAEQHIQQNF